MKKIKLFSILALLFMAETGAVAQTETLLTTITATAKEQASYSTANVATVSFSYTDPQHTPLTGDGGDTVGRQPSMLPKDIPSPNAYSTTTKTVLLQTAKLPL